MSTSNFVTLITKLDRIAGLPLRRLVLTGFFLGALLLIPLHAFSQADRRQPPQLHLETIEATGLTVRFQEPLRSSAQTVAALYPRMKSEIGDRLGLKVSFPTVVTLLADAALFQSFTGSPLIVAFAIPVRNHVVIDYSRIGAHPWTLEAVLKHEVCHLLLHDQLGNNLPKWFDEGLCQWVSEGAAEILLQQKSTILHQAALSGLLFTLDQLTFRFPNGGKDLILAYEESRSVVDYIVDRHGQGAVQELVVRLKGGESMEQAVPSALSVSLQAFEGQWRKSLRSPVYWFYVFSSYLYEILFFVAAVAAIWGFLRALRRRRERRALETEDT